MLDRNILSLFKIGHLQNLVFNYHFSYIPKDTWKRLLFEFLNEFAFLNYIIAQFLLMSTLIIFNG